MLTLRPQEILKPVGNTTVARSIFHIQSMVLTTNSSFNFLSLLNHDTTFLSLNFPYSMNYKLWVICLYSAFQQLEKKATQDHYRTL